jgi:hypothetical protein
MRRIIRAARALLIGTVLGGSLLASAALTAGTASASTVPVIYAAHADGWHGYVKPGQVQFFLNGGGPFITNLTWKSWSANSAWGTGRLWTQQPGCTPIASCRYYSRWVGLSMTTIRKHGAQAYYARMAAEFFVSGKARWDVGWLSGNGFWTFPGAWPYL